MIVPTSVGKHGANFCSGIFAGRRQPPAIVRGVNNRPVSRHFQTGLQNAPAAFFGIVNVSAPPRSSAWRAS